MPAVVCNNARSNRTYSPPNAAASCGIPIEIVEMSRDISIANSSILLTGINWKMELAMIPQENVLASTRAAVGTSQHPKWGQSGRCIANIRHCECCAATVHLQYKIARESCNAVSRISDSAMLELRMQRIERAVWNEVEDELCPLDLK